MFPSNLDSTSSRCLLLNLLLVLLLSTSLGFSSVSSFSSKEQLAMSSFLGELVEVLVEEEDDEEVPDEVDDELMTKCVSTPDIPRLLMVVAMVCPEVLVLFAKELLPPEPLLSLLEAASHSFIVLSECDSQCKLLAISSKRQINFKVNIST